MHFVSIIILMAGSVSQTPPTHSEVQSKIKPLASGTV